MHAGSAQPQSQRVHIITVCADTVCGAACVQLGVGGAWPGQRLTTGFCGDVPHYSVLSPLNERVLKVLVERVTVLFFVTAMHAEQAAAA